MIKNYYLQIKTLDIGNFHFQNVKRNYQGLQSLYSISYAIVLLETCFCVDVFGYNSSFTSLIPHRISFCRNDMLGDFAFLHQSTHVG